MRKVFIIGGKEGDMREKHRREGKLSKGHITFLLFFWKKVFHSCAEGRSGSWKLERLEGQVKNGKKVAATLRMWVY